MGWWGSDVMAGDTPLDILGMFADKLGLPFIDRGTVPGLDAIASYPFSKEIVNAGLDSLSEMIENLTWDKEIAYQVLGVIIMETGANMPDDLRGYIRAACLDDEWAKEGDEERCQNMDAYRKMIDDYTGTPTMYNSEGLFEKMVLAEEKT